MGCAICTSNLNNINQPSNTTNLDLTSLKLKTNTFSFSNTDLIHTKSTKSTPLNSSSNIIQNSTTNKQLFLINKKHPLHNINSLRTNINIDCDKPLLSNSSSLPANTMLKHINNARTNPLYYIEKIEQLKSKIFYNANTNKHYIQLDEQRFLLNKGIESFDNCISYLKLIAIKPQLKPLIMKDELKLPFPNHCSSICIENGFLRNLLLFKTVETQSTFTIVDFHYDVCVCDSELSVIMQIIDDTDDNYQRRKNIFNAHVQFVGISEGKIKENICCYYLLFAKSKM